MSNAQDVPFEGGQPIQPDTRLTPKNRAQTACKIVQRKGAATPPLTPAEIEAAIRQAGYSPDQGWVVREMLAGMPASNVRQWLAEALDRERDAQVQDRRWQDFRVKFATEIGVPVGPNVGEKSV